MGGIFRKVLKDQSAATAVEYGLMVGVFALSIVFGMRALTNELFDLWHNVEDHSDAALKAHN